MNISAVFHKSTDNFCFALDENHLVVRLQTGYDVDKAYLHHGDPFKSGIMGGKDTWKSDKVEIKEYIELENHKLWQIIIKPPFKRCRYFFEIISNGEHLFYMENGVKNEQQMKLYSGRRQDFYYPWMNKADINKPPMWVNDTIWYQIFPDRFCNGDSSINPKNVQNWKSPLQEVNNKEVYGGDLQGIINKLDYIKDLGVTGIYMTPINKSSSTHKYNTDDYYEIDPAFGSKETMRNLVKEAHKRGIKVMLDGVFNHCGIQFAPWADVVKNGPKSKYFDWFMINNWPFTEDGGAANNGDFFAFAFSDRMPKLNTNNQEVIDYFIDVCTYWVKEYNIDALRLDVANETSHKFNRALKERMSQIKPELYILGEIWHNSTPWLRGEQFDSVMNYPLQETINDFWMIPEMTSKQFEYGVNRCFTMYMQQTNDVLFNMLDSHDTIRLVTKLGDKNKFYQQLAVLFTMPGTVCIFYGTEVALQGSFDPDCRRCMPWKEIEQGVYNEELVKTKTLMKLRQENSACKSQNYSFSHYKGNSRVLSYTKQSEDEVLEIIINCSNKDIEVDCIQENIKFANLYSNGIIKADGVIICKK